MPLTPPRDSQLIADYITSVFSQINLGVGVRVAFNSASIAQVDSQTQPSDIDLISISMALAAAPSGSFIWRAASNLHDKILYFTAPDEVTVVNTLSAMTGAYDKSHIDWVGLGAIFMSASLIAAGGRAQVANWFNTNSPLFSFYNTTTQMGIPASQEDMDTYLAVFEKTMNQWVTASLLSGSRPL